jgi:hypothetical protein
MKIRARLRTQDRGAQRGPTAQASFRNGFLTVHNIFTTR